MGNMQDIDPALAAFINGVRKGTRQFYADCDAEVRKRCLAACDPAARDPVAQATMSFEEWEKANTRK